MYSSLHTVMVCICITTTTTTILRPFVQDYPGEPVCILVVIICILVVIGGISQYDCFFLPSVLWHCWVGVRKNIRPVKNWMMRCYLSRVRCKWFAYGPADATASLASLNPEWFHLSGAHLRRKEAVKQVSVCLIASFATDILFVLFYWWYCLSFVYVLLCC